MPNFSVKFIYHNMTFTRFKELVLYSCMLYFIFTAASATPSTFWSLSKGTSPGRRHHWAWGIRQRCQFCGRCGSPWGCEWGQWHIKRMTQKVLKVSWETELPGRHDRHDRLVPAVHFSIKTLSGRDDVGQGVLIWKWI